MPQVCSTCSRVNPPEASYCYFDGSILAGHQRRGPVNPGAQLFPHAFHFPDGQACRNFDELATACQHKWSIAVDLLKQGFFAGFLGGLGRSDLALAAQEAARFPDADRGLDQLLSKLPTQVLQAPQLKVEPTTINLGVVPMGEDRTFEVHLTNLGMRLLYGSISSDSKWLALGDAPQKLFQFGAENLVTVHVRGQHLRAGTKALEGSLLVESNGGSATVTVLVEVPIVPFSEGVLSGALTPRQIAEKAKPAPLEAAPLFENGAVARWFAHNGWTYPVQGPPSSGMSAVQQFFEALGLTKPPKVEVTTPALVLEGEIGQALETSIELKSSERKPVFAHATADQPWLDVSRVKLNGRFATIRVIIVGVPNRPGEVLQATITVTGNGNQRFYVPLTLSVRGSPWANLAPMDAIVAVPGMAEVALNAEPVVVPAIAIPSSGGTLEAMPVTPPPLPVDIARSTPPPPSRAMPIVAQAVPITRGADRLWLHLIPLAALFLGLILVLLRDILAK